MVDSLVFYNMNAEHFFASTIEADVSDLRSRFLAYLSSGAYILDLGCGSGRDTKAFLDMGYKVDAIDGSEELCKKASEYTGIQVKCSDFKSLDEVDKYDGVWACASLLHVRYDKLTSVLTKIRNSLRTGGILYMSFKTGERDELRDGRYFTDMNDERFDALDISSLGFEVLEKWETTDVRPERDIKWFNVIVKKV